MESSGYLIGFTIYFLAWLILYAISKRVNLSAKGVNIGPFYAQYKTIVFNKFLKRMGKYRRLWRVTGNIAVALAIGQMIFITISLTRNLFLLMEKAEGAYQLIPIVPGLTISFSSLPYILLTLAVLLLSHEAAHGIVSIAEGIPIKSSGLFIALVIPGGFVEIDEEKLKKAEPSRQLRIFAAGSSTNLVIGIIFLLLIASFPYTLSPFYNTKSQGVITVSIIEGSGADEAGLKQWTAINKINDTKIKHTMDLMNFMRTTSPNDKLILETDNGPILVTIKPHPTNSSIGLIGVIPFDYYQPKFDWLPKQSSYHIFIMEYWMNTILISVALINMLPVYPLDGGRIVESLLQMSKIKRGYKIKLIISGIFATILIANFVFSFIRYGLGKI